MGRQGDRQGDLMVTWSEMPRSPGHVFYDRLQVDYDGHISRRGHTHLRGLLYEAATVLLTRTSAESLLRTWGLKLKERIGFKRAAVAVARKLAVVMHAMLRSGQLFDRTAGVAA